MGSEVGIDVGRRWRRRTLRGIFVGYDDGADVGRLDLRDGR